MEHSTQQEPDPTPGAETSSGADTPPGANRVLVMSTIAFTLMFAAWLMFGVLGIPIQEEFGLSDSQLSWLIAVAILNGALWRFPAGIVTDHFGGRIVFAVMLFATAAFSYLVSQAESYGMLMLLAFLVGMAGNSFSVGIAWNAAWFPPHRQGFALGLFGAGNVGAAVTKLIGPGIITATAGVTYFGFVEGGWRMIPVIYAATLVLTAVALLVITPRQDRKPARGRKVRSELETLKRLRVWRFSLYYMAVFGAYVALSAWLPKYYIDNYDVSLGTAALLTSLFIFPASLLRPLGGWMSDRLGARRLMYWTFGVMLLSTFLLMMPNGHIVVEVMPESDPSGYREVLPYAMGIIPFTVLLVVLGCSMGIGKAAVYKHIPDYFPKDVGGVGGMVGMLGALGGFLLPPLFVYATSLTGLPSATFFVLFLLTLACTLWMHWTVVQMHRRATPELAGHFEQPSTNESTP
ncbi:MAG TPA: nitrate/nitrite transporter [Solirubrobacterales bacterium]|nr:nitrate/nitrite transporter [Solirubrobacterales bacterium]